MIIVTFQRPCETKGFCSLLELINFIRAVTSFFLNIFFIIKFWRRAQGTQHKLIHSFSITLSHSQEIPTIPHPRRGTSCPASPSNTSQVRPSSESRFDPFSGQKAPHRSIGF